MSNNDRQPAETMDAHQQTDADIVHRVLAGERDAFALLVERYLRIVKVSLAGRGLRNADLDDAAQAAFIATFQHLHRLRNLDSFGAYILKVAQRIANRRPVIHVALESVSEPAAESAPDRGDVSDALETAVARLPHHMQVVLGLKFQQELTAAEIAKQLGQTIGAVTKTLSRAYACLRQDAELRREVNHYPSDAS